jgi:hypothetical protein
MPIHSLPGKSKMLPDRKNGTDVAKSVERGGWRRRRRMREKREEAGLEARSRHSGQAKTNDNGWAGANG